MMHLADLISNSQLTSARSEMSTEPNPFADRQDYTPAKASNPIAIIFITLVIGFVVFACLVGFIARTAYKHARPTPKVTLQPRDAGASVETERDEFRQSVSAAIAGNADVSDGEIEDMVHRTLKALRAGGQVPLNLPMFIEAVMRSPYAEGLNLSDQIMLRRSLSMYPPDMMDSDYENILAIRRDTKNPELATVDMFLYTRQEQSLSTRWYLVRSNDRWEVYDWSTVEFALRISDEYAMFFSEEEESPNQGTTYVIELIDEASEQFLNGDNDAAYATLRRAERVPVHPAATAYAKLQIAYGWMGVDDYAESKRVLLSVREPDSCWGVWPSLAVCCAFLEEYEEGIEYAMNAKRQCEHHPNAESVLSTLYSNLGRDEESADAIAKTLRLLPADDDAFYDVWDAARTKDLSVLLSSVDANSDQTESRWLMLVSQAGYDAPWGRLVLERIKARSDVPQGITELIRGQLEADAGNLDAAVKWTLQAMQSESEGIRDRARTEHLNQRLQQGKVTELFGESQNARQTAVDMLYEASEYGIVGDYESVARMVEGEQRLAQFPIRVALAGYLYFDAGESDKAIELLESYRTASPTPSESEDWIIHLVDSSLATLWLEGGEMEKFLGEWASDETRMTQALNHLQEDIWSASANKFLDQPPGTPSKK